MLSPGTLDHVKNQCQAMCEQRLVIMEAQASSLVFMRCSNELETAYTPDQICFSHMLALGTVRFCYTQHCLPHWALQNKRICGKAFSSSLLDSTNHLVQNTESERQP